MKHINIPVFVPHIGCPNACTFCNQHKITANSCEVSKEDVKRIADEHLLTVDRKNTYIEIAFFGGSFTGIDVSLQEELLGVAYSYKQQGKIDGIRLSTRPDYIDDEVMERLKKYGVTAVELGVQSSCDEVLLANRRGHTFDDVKKAVGIIREYDVSLGLQIMPGLYKSDYDKDIQTGLDVIALKPDFVRIYPTLVIKETCLCELYEKGEYHPLDTEEAVDICAIMMRSFAKAGIDVIRVGLLGSENISEDSDVVAGPFHPAFGEKVNNKLYFDAVADAVSNKKCDLIEILTSPSDLSKMIGQSRCNITRLKEFARNINVKADSDIPSGSVKVNGKLVKIL